jgi:hypothetical protein
MQHIHTMAEHLCPAAEIAASSVEHGLTTELCALGLGAFDAGSAAFGVQNCANELDPTLFSIHRISAMV